ncbi:divergent polysaccharide deacetylase family protein [Roseospira marina]|nr:divergent polysaccharide deacetylase family protein [Roseospira marina]MBB4315230.1 polysaccharide deacetylase 2 family uncharacterized protein YibQ [Roseospira marina]MBB5088230.1 polysaccharide deacetylase 2 family uncharacterized protein YibQ [Roseospira marina]
MAGTDPDLSVPLTPPGAGDMDMDLDLDLDDGGGPRRAPGVVARLFGAGRGRSRGPTPGADDPFAGLRDIDGGPLRASGRRGPMIAAGLGLLLLAGGGYALYANGVFGGDEAPPAPATATAEPDANGVQYVAPDLVVMTLPPRPAPGSMTPDTTAATDRSPARRPWLTADAQDGAPAPESNTGDARTPDAPSPDSPSPNAPSPNAPESDPASDAAMAPEQTDPAEPAHAPTESAHNGTAMAEAGHGPAAEANHGADQGAAPGAAQEGEHVMDHGAAAPSDGVRAQSGPATPDVAPPDVAVSDVAVSDVAVSDVPGLQPVPPGVQGIVEPESPRRLGEPPPVPSYDALTPASRGEALAPSPIPALQADSPYGKVPTVAADGRRPWQVYAAPDPAPAGQPRVAIIVRDLGMMSDALEAATVKLPPAVTLSFTPYARDLGDKMAMARRAGHETLLDLPTEAAAYPAADPGPMGLLTLLPPDDLMDRLQQVLATSHGYVGVLAHEGDRLSASTENMQSVLTALRQSGLLYVHDGPMVALAANRQTLPARTVVDVDIDKHGFAESIKARLGWLTEAAKARGTAVGVMRATPLGFTLLREWIAGLEPTDVALVPVSAVIRRAGGTEDAPLSGAPAHSEAEADAGHSPESGADGHAGEGTREHG